MSTITETDIAFSKSIMDLGFEIVATREIPVRVPEFAPVPTELHAGIRQQLTQKYPGGLYRHQSQAIQAVLNGEDICVATSTASGKSLIFISAAANLALNDPYAKVLALYPAKALIQDQIEKWRASLDPLGISLTFIDGSVDTKSRANLIHRHRVILMTPDVAHAWLMSHAEEREPKAFIASIRLLILDEAHIYEGVFGTNMAYLMRRFAALASQHRLICTTATIGEPGQFTERLLGRHLRVFGPEFDKSASPHKQIYAIAPSGGSVFDRMVTCVRCLPTLQKGKFIVFGDSRRLVEQIVAATMRSTVAEQPDGVETPEIDEKPHFRADDRILPYRSGYEDEDRKSIQEALAKGTLAGVVSTSALELGIDIGEVETVVLLGLPTSAKSFWQRLGRAGRSRKGRCIIMDISDTLHGSAERLDEWLTRPLEPNWLYLDNRYLQYTNALCAAAELSGTEDVDNLPEVFKTLPDAFRNWVRNELNPAEVVPTDLYPLKQRAAGGPHLEFPLRSGIEKQFQVKNSVGHRLGNLSYSQALREAYPGAIYHYMATPYRVYRFSYHHGEISVKRTKRWTTRPISQTMVFPRFQGGILNLRQSNEGFVAEADMQVSERVLGFTEQCGTKKTNYHYGPESEYSQKELIRFFVTTGVCWYFSSKPVISEVVATLVKDAFCAMSSVQDRDLGIGGFYAKKSPHGPDVCQGIAIYDATNGSLRLTQRLLETFDEVLSSAIENARRGVDKSPVEELSHLQHLVATAASKAVVPLDDSMLVADGDWREVVEPGQKAMCVGEAQAKEVEVIGYRYTPQGLVYDIKPPFPEQKLTALARAIQPINGVTKMLRVNLMTGETQPASA